MTDNEKKLNEQELNEVNGGFGGFDFDLNKIFEKIVTSLKQSFPQAEDAIKAIEEDAETISPDVKNLINLIGKTKIVQEIRNYWNI